MTRRLLAAMLGLALALFLTPQISLAAEDHIAEAISHTKEAIDHGKRGHAGILVTHAEAGKKVKANPHTKEGIKHLKEALDHGKQGHADIATTHAQMALDHLEQAK